MDPITLFALANGAVSAVKAGCKLYKDIKGAAGEVKEVLKDLDDQVHKLHPPEKPPTVEQRNQFIEEKNRIIELNKRDGETTGIYTELGEHLGTYYDNYYKCMAIFEEEEKRSKTEVYTGDSSLGKRALQRVLMRKQLEQMSVDLRQLMIYESPPELGALYTEVEDMMKSMGKEQRILIARKMRDDAAREKKRKDLMQRYWLEGVATVGMIAVIGVTIMMLALVVEDRIQKYPQYGNEWIPKSEKTRQEEMKPKIYIGR